MADVTVTTGSDSGGSEHFRGLVFTDADTVYYFFNDANNLHYKKSTDGGATWGSDVVIKAFGGADFRKFAVWPDWETPGNTGTNINISYLQGPSALFKTLDITDDTLSSEIVIKSPVGAGSTTNNSPTYTAAVMDVVRSRGGNLYCAVVYADATNPGAGFFRSVDDGATWTERATVFDATTVDRLVLQPGNEADPDDIWAFFYDNSANEFSLKVYDNSGDSWAETSMATGVTIVNVQANHIAAAVRHSDNHSIVLAQNNSLGSALTDLLAFDVGGSSDITALTDVYTNEDGHIACQVQIDQNDDTVYAWHGFSSPANGGNMDIFRQKSSKGGTTWDSAVLYNEGGTGSYREIIVDPSVGGTRGGRIAAVWVDDGPTPDDHFFNVVNSIQVESGASPVAISAQVGMQQRELLLF